MLCSLHTPWRQIHQPGCIITRALVTICSQGLCPLSSPASCAKNVTESVSGGYWSSLYTLWAWEGANPSVPPSQWPLFPFLFLGCTGAACRVLVPQRGIKPVPPAVEAWGLNHWTSREVPGGLSLDSPYFFRGYTLTSVIVEDKEGEEKDGRFPFSFVQI